MPCSRTSSGHACASIGTEHTSDGSAMTGAVASPGRTGVSAWWWRHQRALTPLILLAPACLMFATFVIYPIGQSLWLSLYDWDGVGPKTWVGLGNFAELAADPPK